MRIISGTHKGIILHPPKGLPVRPTTDRAKESLFNIIENNFHIDRLHVIDLFSGTGNIGYEFCSRGAASVVAVDRDFGCVNYIKSVKKQLYLEQLQVLKQDVYTYLNQCMLKADIVFADAPYADSKLITLPQLVFSRQLLNENGWLIVEHASHLDFKGQYGYFDKRIYGQSAFSFFKAVANN